MLQLDKEYYKIKEVAEILDVPQSTLRFWEKEFASNLKPMRTPHNIRYYRPKDIETLRIIHFLVKVKGLKIEAAREELRRNPHNLSTKVEVLEELREIRGTLSEMYHALSGRKI